MSNTAELARAFYKAYEPIHSSIYFVSAANEHFQEIGLRPGWMGYFASRSAPMGAVGPEVVAATFYSFAPTLVAKYIPIAWSLAPPEAVTSARLSAVSEMLAAVLDNFEIGEITKLIELLEPIALDLALEGHPLFAGHRSVALLENPQVRLWQILTLFREHRGDSHLACLASVPLSGVEANLIHHLDGRAPKEFLTRARGYGEEDWARAAARLAERGLVNEDGSALTVEGVELKRTIEADTDRLASQVPAALSPEQSETVIASLGKIAHALQEHHGLTF